MPDTVLCMTYTFSSVLQWPVRLICLLSLHFTGEGLRYAELKQYSKSHVWYVAEPDLSPDHGALCFHLDTQVLCSLCLITCTSNAPCCALTVPQNVPHSIPAHKPGASSKSSPPLGTARGTADHKVSREVSLISGLCVSGFSHSVFVGALHPLIICGVPWACFQTIFS